jgi:hypothetical protein
MKTLTLFIALATLFVIAGAALLQLIEIVKNQVIIKQDFRHKIL